MYTNGYGGHTVKKIIKVHTNDPVQKLIRLQISGPVKKLADLDPGHIELSGKAGEIIKAVMTITPAGLKNDFKIARVMVKENQNIRFEIKHKNEVTPARYELIVENTRKKPGRYADVITLLTDTSPQKAIDIRVFGNITQ